MLHRIDRKLIDRILDGEKAMDAVHKISAYNRPRDGSAPDLGLSRPELNLYLFTDYASVIPGEGHLQYLFGSTQTPTVYTFTTSRFPSETAGRTLEALEEMGLDILASLLREARSWLPSPIPKVEDERRFAALMPPGVLESWASLDERFLDHDLAAYKPIHEYLRRHRSEILAPETA